MPKVNLSFVSGCGIALAFALITACGPGGKSPFKEDIFGDFGNLPLSAFPLVQVNGSEMEETSELPVTIITLESARQDLEKELQKSLGKPCPSEIHEITISKSIASSLATSSSQRALIKSLEQQIESILNKHYLEAKSKHDGIVHIALSALEEKQAEGLLLTNIQKSLRDSIEKNNLEILVTLEGRKFLVMSQWGDDLLVLTDEEIQQLAESSSSNEDEIILTLEIYQMPAKG